MSAQKIFQAFVAVGGVGALGATMYYAINLQKAVEGIQETVMSINQQLQHVGEHAHSVDARDECPEETRIFIFIHRPKTDESIHVEWLDIVGEATRHGACRYVWILLQDQSWLFRYYMVTDQAQLQEDGSWAARLLLDDIDPGSRAEVRARLTQRPQTYQVLSAVTYPLQLGTYSDAVVIRTAGVEQ
jgi:hypothetical protein